jgi:hypothetical protein
MGCGWVAIGDGVGRKVLSIDAYVEAGLLKLLFHVDFAFLHEG